MSTATFVQQLYSTLLGRAPDGAGVDFWTKAIDSGALSAAEVTQSFLDSAEFADAVQPVARLYIAAFGRIPDEAGLSFWTHAAQAGTSLEAIAAAFGASAEFQTSYANLADAGFIDALYQVALGHGADAAAKADWLAKLASGAPRTDVLSAVAASAEMSADQAETVKIIAAYHGTVGTAPTQQQIDAALAAHDRAGLIASLYASADYHGAAVPGLELALAPSGNALIALAGQLAATQHVGLNAAAQLVQQAFGLASSIHVLTDDPGSIAASAHDPALQSAALQAYKTEVQLQSALDTLSATLRGQGVHVDQTQADAAVLQAMASVAMNGSLNLTLTSTVQTLLGAAAKLLNADPLVLAAIGATGPIVARGIAAISIAVAEAHASTPATLLNKIATIDANAAKVAASLLHGDLTGALDASSASALSQPLETANHGGGGGVLLSGPPELQNVTLSDPSTLVLTFSEDVKVGSGSIYLTNGVTQTIVNPSTGAVATRIIDATDTRTITISDSSHVTFDDSQVVTVHLGSPLETSKAYSLLIGGTAIKDSDNEYFFGLFDSTQRHVYNTTVSADVTAFTLTDNGISDSDGITSSASQSITGTYSGTLASGSTIQVLINNVVAGNAVVDTGNHSFSFNGGVLNDGANDVLVQVKDSGGATSTGVTHAITLDSTSPTAHVASTLITVPLTIVFDEAVYLDPNTNTDSITLNGGAGTVSLDSANWVFNSDHTELTLQAANTLLDNHSYTLFLPSTLVDAAGNPVPSSLNFIAGDGLPNALSATFTTEGRFHTNATISISVQFDEAVTTVNTPTLELDIGGTPRTATYASGSGTNTLVFNYVVQPGDNDDFIHLDSTAGLVGTIEDSDGNLLDSAHIMFASSTGDAAADTTAPTATLAISSASLNAGQTATVTLQFSEAVQNVDLSHFTAEHGTLSDLASADEGVTWTATFTPTEGVETTTATIGFDMTTVKDLADNAGTDPVNSGSFAIDTLLPTATVAMADYDLHAGESTTVTVTFSEAVTGLSSTAFTAPGGDISNVVDTNGGTIWTATFTPDEDTEISPSSLEVDLSNVEDLNGNAGTDTASSTSYVVDTIAPLVSSIELDKSILNPSQTATLTVVFSEAVTALPTSAFTYNNGTLSEFTSADGDKTWTATFTPTSISDSTNEITLDATQVSDTHGNPGSGMHSTANYVLDAAGPTIVSLDINDNQVGAGDTPTVTVVFSEAVTDVTAAKFSVSCGTLGTPVASEDGTTWTATFTPTTNLPHVATHMSFNAGAVHDVAGNAGSGTAQTSYDVDTIVPTLTSVTIEPSTVIADEEATVTVQFSEAVYGLTLANFSSSSGTFAEDSLTTTDHITWTATFIPDTETSDANSVVTVSTSDLADATGNAVSGDSASTSAFVVDTKLPDIDGFTISDTSILHGETATVTITFSEAVTDLSSDNFTAVGGGTLGAPTPSGDNTVWTMLFTPTEDFAAASNTITVGGTVHDANGNASVISDSLPSYAVDTQVVHATAAAFTSTQTVLHEGDTLHINVSFDHSVTVSSTSYLALETGDTDHSATIATGTSGTSLTYTYTVQSGDYTTSLALASGFANALVAGLTDSLGNPLDAANVDFSALTASSYGVAVNAEPASTITGLGLNSDHISTDTGWSDTDNYTLLTQPTVHGTGATAGMGVSIYEGETLVGSGTAESDGSYDIEVIFGEGSISGSHTVYAVALSSDELAGGHSDDFTFDIDTTAPTVASITTGTTATSQITLTFSEAVHLASGTTLTLDGGQQTSAITANVVVNGSMVTLVPETALVGGQVYLIGYSNFIDQAGNTPADDISLTANWFTQA